MNYYTLRYTLSNGYMWDFHLLLDTQQLLHLYSLHPNDSTVQRAAHCIQNTMVTTCWPTHGSEALHTQLLRNVREQRITMPVFPVKDSNRTRGSGEEYLNHMREPATVQSLLGLFRSQKEFWTCTRRYNIRYFLTNSVTEGYACFPLH